MTKAVFKFFWDCGRQGDVEGLFISTRDEIKRATGGNVYFGEILGKHSEVYGTLDEGDVTLLTDNEEVVKFVEEHGPFGYNPLHAISIDCEECGTLIEEAFSRYGQKQIDACEECDCPHKNGAVAE